MNLKSESTIATLINRSAMRTGCGSCCCCCFRTRTGTNSTRRSTWRPSKQQRQQSSVRSPHAPPALRQRPQYDNNIPPPFKKSIHDEHEDVKKRATAADVLRLIDSLQLPVDADTYRSLIKECTLSRDAVEGAKIHAHIKKTTKEKKSSSRSRRLVSVTNRLLLMYTACDRPDTARQLFDEMPVRNAGSWATVISSLAHSGNHGEALGQFVDMMRWQSAVEPTDTLILLITFVLRSCVQVGDMKLGKQIHGLVAKMAATATLTTPMLQFYAGLGCTENARKLFDSMVPCSHDAATIVCAYCKQGQFQEAFHFFGYMFNATRLTNDEKMKKNVSAAFTSILSACVRMEMGEERIGCCRQVHASAVKMRLDVDLYVGTSLVNMYGKFGLLVEARKAFEAICDTKDPACWNAMLSSFVCNGCCAEAVKLLYEMKSAGIEPLESIVCRVRIACGG